MWCLILRIFRYHFSEPWFAHLKDHIRVEEVLIVFTDSGVFMFIRESTTFEIQIACPNKILLTSNRPDFK